MEEIDDLLSNKWEREEISDRLLQAELRKDKLRGYFNETIYTYLRKTKKPIGEIDLEDYNAMTEWCNPKQKQLFMEQFLKALKTNRGKSLQWIKENNKSILLNQID
jgi:hypothetical protein